MAVKPVPDGYHTVTPYLTVSDAAGLIRFLEQAFDGKCTERMEGPDGKVAHAEVRLGDSIVMIGQARGESSPMPGQIYLYLPDCDSAYKRALAAGATSVREPTTQFYGDRSSGVRDPFGNLWWPSTRVESVSPEEMERRMKAQAPK